MRTRAGITPKVGVKYPKHPLSVNPGSAPVNSIKAAHAVTNIASDSHNKCTHEIGWSVQIIIIMISSILNGGLSAMADEAAPHQLGETRRVMVIYSGGTLGMVWSKEQQPGISTLVSQAIRIFPRDGLRDYIDTWLAVDMLYSSLGPSLVSTKMTMSGV